jgi:hypothetical protein
VEYVDNLLLQCDKCRTIVHMNSYGVLEPPDGKLCLCSLCGVDAPKQRPLCCLCPHHKWSHEEDNGWALGTSHMCIMDDA